MDSVHCQRRLTLAQARGNDIRALCSCTKRLVAAGSQIGPDNDVGGAATLGSMFRAWLFRNQIDTA